MLVQNEKLWKVREKDSYPPKLQRVLPFSLTPSLLSIASLADFRKERIVIRAMMDNCYLARGSFIASF
jgi:hypothetical protein